MGFGAVELGKGLVHDDGDGVVENAFTKDDGVEMGVDFILGEYG